ncbi:MAG: SpoIIE family protein phosphatase [Nitrospirales bacterium]|nr:SpoIIE family protein phosphatase [Nitrospira sp.]MDR4502293.1 SpoIIE family protein phosphatase [Nitrospirales bacterium]
MSLQDTPIAQDGSQVNDESEGETTLLLVEDEKVVRMVTKRRLEMLGYVVLEAENGAQALEVLKTRTVDLILSDWMMPVMDGLALCQIVKADPTWQTIYFILMTALEESCQIAEGLIRGADDFLPKSASEEVIDARVKAGIRSCRLIRKLEHSHRVILQQQAELDAELQSAGNFVLSLLPLEGSPVPNVQVAWQYLPSSRLGGDLFQVARWGTEHLGLMILDMSGHGIGPALRAVSLAMRFRDEHIVQLHPTYDPGEIVERLNRENPLTDQGEYFTIWVGSLHLPTLRLRYTTAGHPGVILTRQGNSMDVLGAKTWPIGFGLDQSYDSQECQLSPGDRLYLFSDGLYEVTSPAGELWDREGLEAACRTVHGKPMKKALEWVIQQSQAWQKQTNFYDDVALVGVEVI